MQRSRYKGKAARCHGKGLRLWGHGVGRKALASGPARLGYLFTKRIEAQSPGVTGDRPSLVRCRGQEGPLV